MGKIGVGGMTSPAGGDGGNGGNPGTAGPGTAPTTPAPAPAAPPAPAGTGQPGTGPQPQAGNAGTGNPADHGFQGDYEPARARATIDAQRAEVADLRRQLAEARGTQNAGTAGKPPADDAAAGKAGAADDATVAAERDAAKARADHLAEEARQARLDLAIHQRAGTAGADPVALVDSLAFRNATKGLDPNAADFGDQLTAAITAAIDTNPSLRARGQVPGASGADTAGRTGMAATTRQVKPLADAVAAHYGT